MEVCGGHTMAIQKFGISSLLPENLRLISGPGCPVCVTGRKYIDHAIALARQNQNIVATYGDLIRVPGSTSTLEIARSEGADVRVVPSALEALKIAGENNEKKVIFLGIGFETTAPTTAATLQVAKKNKVRNFHVLSAHKTMPIAMDALLTDGAAIDAFLAPGHVSTVTGTGIYHFIPEKYKKPVVIAGFEPVDILQSVLLIVKQVEENMPAVEIQYKRLVKPEGNLLAINAMDEVFEPREDWWRGLGNLPGSGLGPRDGYADFNAERLEVDIEPTIEPAGCICGEVLKGKVAPDQCKLFGHACTPQSPVGACMVSNEGACHANYRYKNNG